MSIINTYLKGIEQSLLELVNKNQEQLKKEYNEELSRETEFIISLLKEIAELPAETKEKENVNNKETVDT